MTILVPKDPCLALLKLNPRSSVTRLPQHRSFDHVAYISCQSSLNRVKHSKFIYIFILTSIHSGGYAKYFNRNQLEIQILYTKCSRMPRKKMSRSSNHLDDAGTPSTARKRNRVEHWSDSIGRIGHTVQANYFTSCSKRHK